MRRAGARPVEPTGALGMSGNRFQVEYEARAEGGHIARLTIDNRAKLNSLDSALLA